MWIPNVKFRYRGKKRKKELKKHKNSVYTFCSLCILLSHSHKKWKDSLEGSLDRVLFAAELEFPKILVPTLPQHISDVNIECAGKSKATVLFTRDQLFGALIHFHFIMRILICFWLMMSDVNYVIYGCSSARTTPEAPLYRSFLTLENNIIAVITQNREKDDNLERQIKNQALCACRLFLLT